MTTTNTKKRATPTITIDGRTIRPDIYRSAELAWQSVAHAVKPMRVMLGDVIDDRPQWWVVTPADAARLEPAGYEFAPR